MKVSKFIAVAAFSLFATMASAVPINWTLNGVTFNDGGTASGSFITDSINGALLGFDITTTLGANQGGFHYDATSASIYANNYFAPNSFIITRNQPFAEPFLNFVFENALDAGGINNLVAMPGGITAISGELSNTSIFPHRFVVSGFASAVPEPESLLLLTLGLFAIAVSRKKMSV